MKARSPKNRRTARLIPKFFRRDPEVFSPEFFLSRAAMLFLIVLLGSLVSYSQAALVRKAVGETEDRIRFEVSLQRLVYSFGESITLTYRISNHSGRTVYLVKETPQAFDDDGVIISIQAPLPRIGGHNYSNFQLRPVRRNRTITGKYTLPVDVYKRSGTVPITIGFAYVTEEVISNSGWKRGDMIEEKPLLGSVAKVLSVGILAADVR